MRDRGGSTEDYPHRARPPLDTHQRRGERKWLVCHRWQRLANITTASGADTIVQLAGGDGNWPNWPSILSRELKLVDLDAMRLFVRTVADGSPSTARREPGLFPATASRHLAWLEQALGVRLLQRSSRRLSLTGEDAVYHERCLGILADVDEAHPAMRP